MVMGVLNNFLPFNFIAFGQLHVTGGMASIVNANTAFMGVIVSGLFLATEPATWNRVIGVIIGVAGVAIAIGVTSELPTGDASYLLLGSLAIILATIAYAFAGVWGIFGHGNVAGLGEALFNVKDKLPTFRGHNEQSMAHAAISFAKQKNRRQMMAVTSSIGPGATNFLTA